MNKSSLNLEAKMIVEKYTSVTGRENNIMRFIADIILLVIRMFKIFMEIINIDDVIDNDEDDFKILLSNQIKSVTTIAKPSIMKEDLPQLKSTDKSCEVIKKKVHFQLPPKDSSLNLTEQHNTLTTSKSVTSIRIIEKQDKSTQTTEMPQGLAQTIPTPKTATIDIQELTSEKQKNSNQIIEIPKRSTQVSEIPKRSTQTIDTPQRSIETTKKPKRSTQFAETPQRSTQFAETPQRSTQITQQSQRSEKSSVLTCSKTKYSSQKSEETKLKVNYTEPTKKVELNRVELLYHLLVMQHLKQKTETQQRFGSTRRRLEFE